jgi:DNA-binding transcriptional LysR family regulator
MGLDIRQIERFVSVIETGSLSVSARQLGLSQPALSKSMRLLEEELDVLLFERVARGVKPTPAGRAFHERARAIAAELRRACDEIEEIKGGSVGRVAIGVAPGPGILDRVLPPAIQSITATRPSLTVRVVSGALVELLPALRRDELDFIVSVIDHDSADPTLRREVLLRDQVAFVVRPGHPLARAGKVTLEQAIGHRWVLAEDAISLWQEVEAALIARGSRTLYAPLESNSVRFVKTTILATDYVGLLPSYALDDRERTERFSVIDIDMGGGEQAAPLLGRSLGLICKTGYRPTPAGDKLMRLIRSAFHALAGDARGA